VQPNVDQIFDISKLWILLDQKDWVWIIKCLQAPVEGPGGAVPLCPDHWHAPPEPEAGSNLLNSLQYLHIFSVFTFLINRRCHNLSILWLFLKFFLIFTIFFFAGFHLKWLVIMVRWLIVRLQVDWYRF